MALTYGFLKCRINSDPTLKSSRLAQETQYHLHAQMLVAASDGGGVEEWDAAINVGTDDADDLLQYRLVYDFHHSGMLNALSDASYGFHDLTGTTGFPAIDFLRSNVLAETGPWRISDILDGTDQPEPVASLIRLLRKARGVEANVYIFGRSYTGGDLGMHDIHMNQGSSSNKFWHRQGNDRNDHNDIWQDGAVLIDFGQSQWSGYFTAFMQQAVPTDNLGNPTSSSHAIGNGDPGGMQ